MEEWRSVLNDEDSCVARDVVRDINTALRCASEEAWFPPTIATEGYHKIARISLDHGFAGLAVYWQVQAETGEINASQLAQAYLDKAAADIARVAHRPSLYEGLTGIAYAADFLVGPDSVPDHNSDVDEVLMAYLHSLTKYDRWDLTTGSIGVGVYFLNRLHADVALEAVSLVVDHLQTCAEQRGAGFRWLSRKEWLDEVGVREYPLGYYNTGMAHGLSGVIAFLGLVAESIPDLRFQVLKLLEGAVAWLRSQCLVGSNVTFPEVIVGDSPRTVDRLAWCYSDLSLSIALFGAGARTERTEWCDLGLTAGLRTTTREWIPKENQAGLCHGTAGLGHMFNRLYQATGRMEFASAAKRWFRATIQARRFGGVAGFQSWFPDREGDNCWPNNPGILNGAAGVSLALTAALGHRPRWDRLFLVDMDYYD